MQEFDLMYVLIVSMKVILPPFLTQLSMFEMLKKKYKFLV